MERRVSRSEWVPHTDMPIAFHGPHNVRELSLSSGSTAAVAASRSRMRRSFRCNRDQEVTGVQCALLVARMPELDDRPEIPSGNRKGVTLASSRRSLRTTMSSPQERDE